MKKRKGKKLINKRNLYIILVIAFFFSIIAGSTYAYFSVSKNSNVGLKLGTFDPAMEESSKFSLALLQHESIGENLINYETGTYVNIYPGSIVEKDLLVKNSGTIDCWVRVNIFFDNASNWISNCNNYDLVGPIVMLNDISDDWIYSNNYTYDSEKNILKYTFYYNEILRAGEVAKLFDSFEVPAVFNGDDMKLLNSFKINVTADAIQSANTGSSVIEAFSTFWEE